LTARPSSFSSRAIRREPRKGHAVNSSSMEKILFRGITGILHDDEDKNEDGKGASA
jgi:hypothetical protein